jgi:tetratricopeptide (TPR) repeat protein
MDVSESDALYSEALSYIKVGGWRSAIVRLYEAIFIDSQKAKYYSLLGIAYLGCQKDDIPLSEVLPYIGIVKTYSEFYEGLARSYFHRAFELDKHDSSLQPYLPFLFGKDDRDNPSGGCVAAKNPKPNFPSGGSEASFIDAEGVARIP